MTLVLRLTFLKTERTSNQNNLFPNYGEGGLFCVSNLIFKSELVKIF